MYFEYAQWVAVGKKVTQKNCVNVFLFNDKKKLINFNAITNKMYLLMLLVYNMYMLYKCI